MQFENRYYQDEALESIHGVCDNEAAILSCPTGGGKTHIACNFIKDEMEKKKSSHVYSGSAYASQAGVQGTV